MVQEQVAFAMCNRAITIGRNGDTEGEVSAYDELIGKYGESEVALIQEQVAIAMCNRAATIGKNGDTESAIASYDELIEKYGENSRLQKLVSMSVVNKALTIVLSGGAVDDKNSSQLSKQSIGGQICFMVARLSSWVATKGNVEKKAVRSLASKVIAQADHEAERLELTLGIAALMEPVEALNILKQSGALDELKPIAVYLQRQSYPGKREVFELSEMANDVTQRVSELREELYKR